MSLITLLKIALGISLVYCLFPTPILKETDDQSWTQFLRTISYVCL